MEIELTDEALVAKYRQAKDMNAFKTLVRRYQNRVFNAAYRILGNTEEAEEVVQDTLLKMHQGMDSLRSDTTFAAWLFRISHNICVDILRNRSKKRQIKIIPFVSRSVYEENNTEMPDAGIEDIAADIALEPDLRLDLKEESAVLEHSLKRLPEAQRAVLVLHDLEGFAYHEIAEIIGASIGTVRSRLHYGRIKLKELLDSYYSPSNQPITPR